MSEMLQTKPDPAIKLRVDDAFKAEIEEAAREMHVSVSAFTRLALAEYVRRRKAPTTPNQEEA